MKTIKQRISYAVMGLMAMGFTACTQNEDMTPTLKGQEINATFSVGGMQTRVNTLGHGDNWEDKDKLKVSIFTDSDPGCTVVLSFNGETNEWSRNRSFRWLDEVDKHFILAVYPSSDDYVPYHLVYELPTNQSSPKDLKSADLINGFRYDRPDLDNIIKINMKHRMSLVTIMYHIGTADYPNLDISSLKICSPCSGASFKLPDDKNEWKMDTSNYQEAKLVDACKTEDGEEKFFSAIIVPGTVGTDKEFLKFSIGEKNFVSKLKSQTDFEEGKRYTYKLDVGKDKVELTRISIDDLKGWDSNNEEDLK
ncbi:fimbrillin family protein [Segatella copri]|uniref:fimbrillin family protein n=1 Tax=Segatella copri TaxID=165179 RepID=UPI001C46ED33|nr:fimbrillin family protein [Segatella copri]MBW0022923.1 fimbrillin family protein [Segatella copri]